MILVCLNVPLLVLLYIVHSTVNDVPWWYNLRVRRAFVFIARAKIEADCIQSTMSVLIKHVNNTLHYIIMNATQ